MAGPGLLFQTSTMNIFRHAIAGLACIAASATIAEPALQGFSPSALTDVNGTLFVVAKDGEHGYELWKIERAASKPVLVNRAC